MHIHPALEIKDLSHEDIPRLMQLVKEQIEGDLI